MDDFGSRLEKDILFTLDRIRTYERNKAIDDFLKMVRNYDWNIRGKNENDFIYGALDYIAEQLKAGGENDKSI